jgi:hypothetical protein
LITSGGARDRLAKEDSSYGDARISIYSPTLERLKSGNSQLYEEVQSELENSKAFRNAVIPTAFLLGWFGYTSSIAPALVSLVALITFVEVSFRARAQHSLKAYRWLVEKY